MAEAAPSDTASKLGHEFGAMLAGMPEDFLRMVIERRRAGNGGADSMFKILAGIDEKLSQLDPGAVQRFTDSARSELPRGHRVRFDELIALAWCGNPPGLLDRLFPGVTDAELREALSVWPIEDPMAIAAMIDALRLDESLQRAHHLHDKWLHTWQVDEMSHKRPLVGRELRVAPGTCPCAAEAGAAVVEDVVASGSSREGVGFRTLGLVPACWKVSQASDTDLMMELGPSELISQLEPSALCDCGAPLASTGYVLLNYPKSRRCTLPGRCPFSASSLYIALRDNSGLRSTVRSGPAFTAVAREKERSYAYDLDLVLSIPGVSWPPGVAEAYQSRQQYNGCVTKTMVKRLTSARLYMVAAGFKRSPSTEDQWRYSFSRQEYMLMRRLEPEHRECLVALKIAKNLLGSKVPGLKSYHLKTGVMWVAERREKPDSLHEHLLAVLNFVIRHVEKGELPCYFWAEINLLGALTADERTELTESLRCMRATLVSVLNIYVHRAVLGVDVKPGQNPNLFSTLSDVDQLALSCACFSKSCADRLHRAAYEHHREQALLGGSTEGGESRLSASEQRRLVSLLRRPLPDGGAHLVHAIASLPRLVRAEFPDDDRDALRWELELAWFFQEGVRQQAVPYLEQLDVALFAQYRLPEEARLAELPAELCRPVRLLTAQQLCRLYTQQQRLLLALLGTEQHLLIPLNMAREDAKKTSALLRDVSPADLRDKWME